MNCSEISTLLEPHTDKRLTSAQHALGDEHLGRCDSCCSAGYALTVLRSHRDIAVPPPRAGLLSEMIAHVSLVQTAAVTRTGDRFWLGAGLGGALAAGIVFALLNFNAIYEEQPGSNFPQLNIALNDTRDVNVAIESPATPDQDTLSDEWPYGVNRLPLSSYVEVLLVCVGDADRR